MFKKVSVYFDEKNKISNKKLSSNSAFKIFDDRPRDNAFKIFDDRPEDNVLKIRNNNVLKNKLSVFSL